MDVHDDKILYRLIFGILGLCFIPMLLFFYLNAGINGFVFVVWIFLALSFFIYVVALTLDKATAPEEKTFIGSYLSQWANIVSYKIVYFLVFAILASATIFIWNFLGL